MTTRGTLKLILAAVFLLAGTGCQTFHSGPQANLQEIYHGAAKRTGIERRAVIVIPGILGSRLVNNPSGQTIWGAFSREAAKPTDPKSARLIALPMARNKPPPSPLRFFSPGSGYIGLFSYRSGKHPPINYS